LANRVVNAPEPQVSDFGNPIRMAWGVMFVAFAAFCLVCAASTLWIHYFFFQSSVGLNTRLQVGSGTIGVQTGSSAEQTATGERSISTGTLIRTDRTNLGSQATMTFQDTNDGDRLVASVTLMGNTTVRLTQALQPRFEWTSGFYNMRLDGLNGEVHITISDDLQRDVALSIAVGGAEVRVLDVGQYVVRNQGSEITVTNRGGQVLLIGPDGVEPRSIPQDYFGVYSLGASQITLTPASVNLLVNNELNVFRPADYSTENARLGDNLRGWDCSTNYEFVNRTPLGDYEAADAPDGRASFRLVRNNAANNVGTGCRQDFAGPGIEVTDFDDLRLQATVYVDSQSVSGCGERASECPLMMRVRFQIPRYDENDVPIYIDGEQDYVEVTWIHGVYAILDPNIPWPLICDTCRRDHVRVNEGGWYIYDSGNLFNIFQTEACTLNALDDLGTCRKYVKEVEFYASGHNYDVYVSDMSLLAEDSDRLSQVR